MIGYATLGTNDLDKAVAFYGALFADLGAKQFPGRDGMMMWSISRDKPMLAVCKPFDGNAAGAGNGSMVALRVDDAETVAKLHAKALELGGSNEGDPGPRGGSGLTFGYFRDLDGNKMAFFAPAGDA